MELKNPFLLKIQNNNKSFIKVFDYLKKKDFKFNSGYNYKDLDEFIARNRDKKADCFLGFGKTLYFSNYADAIEEMANEEIYYEYSESDLFKNKLVIE